MIKFDLHTDSSLFLLTVRSSWMPVRDVTSHSSIPSEFSDDWILVSSFPIITFGICIHYFRQQLFHFGLLLLQDYDLFYFYIHNQGRCYIDRLRSRWCAILFDSHGLSWPIRLSSLSIYHGVLGKLIRTNVGYQAWFSSWPSTDTNPDPIEAFPLRITSSTRFTRHRRRRCHHHVLPHECPPMFVRPASNFLPQEMSVIILSGLLSRRHGIGQFQVGYAAVIGRHCCRRLSLFTTDHNIQPVTAAASFTLKFIRFIDNTHKDINVSHQVRRTVVIIIKFGILYRLWIWFTYRWYFIMIYVPVLFWSVDLSD